MEAFPATLHAQLGVALDGQGHRRTPSNVSNVSSSTSSNHSGHSPEGYSDMFGHSLDNQSPSAAGPYRTDRSASIVSLDPSESSIGASRHERSRTSSISMPYPSQKPPENSEGWASEATSLFQQLQEVQINHQTRAQPFLWPEHQDWPYTHSHGAPDPMMHPPLADNGANYPPSFAVSGPDSNMIPMIRASDASSMSFAANHQLNFGDSSEEAAADEARQEQLAALARAVRSANTTSQGDKARSSFVQTWLTCNYVVWPEGNVSRQALYSSYSRICDRYGVRGINSASFGKAVRAAFPQIKTRRLGVRGNSKYHYCGMRPSNMSEARLLAELSANDGASDPTGHAARPSNASDDSGDSGGASPGSTSKRGPPVPPPALNLVPPVMIPHDFPSVEEAIHVASAASLNPDHVREVWGAFTRTAVDVIEAFNSAKFSKLELALRAYYTETLSNEEHGQLLRSSAVSTLNIRGLASCFNACLGLLQERALMPATDGATTLNQFSVLKQMADSMERVVSESTGSIGPVSATMVELAARFGHLVNRHLGLCQVVQALLGIIDSRTAVEDLLESWESMDFESICNHCTLAINCDRNKLSWSFDTFGHLLKASDNFSLLEVTHWIDQLMTTLTSPDRQGRMEYIPPQALLMRSSFVMTQLMRDLTLRSDRSFGTFQLLSLFFQEWIGIAVMRQMTLSSQAVAASLPSSPAQLHSPAISLSSAASQDPASATGVAPQDSAIFLAPSGSADVPTAFSPRTAHFLAGTGASGNTPQFASFAQNNSFLDEHQKTAMTTPMASSWRSKGGATPLASTEDANQPAYWDNAAVPVVPISPFISDFFPSFSVPDSSANNSESEGRQQ